MDVSRFDRFIKTLTHAGTRRDALGLAAGVAGLAVSHGAARPRRKHRRGRRVRAQGSKADKVLICHFTGSEANPYEVLEVSGNAYDKHVANHGDFAVNAEDGCCLDSDCAAFVDSVCDEAADGGAQCACDPTTFAPIPTEACDAPEPPPFPCSGAACGKVYVGLSPLCCSRRDFNCQKHRDPNNEIVAFCLPQR